MLELCLPFELSQAGCDQSASLEVKEAGATTRALKKTKQQKTGSYRKQEQQQHGCFIATGQCYLTKEEHRMTVKVFLYFQLTLVRIQCSSNHLPGFLKVPPQTRMDSLNICAPITHF